MTVALMAFAPPEGDQYIRFPGRHLPLESSSWSRAIKQQ
jgi:hypothetical protein